MGIYNKRIKYIKKEYVDFEGDYCIEYQFFIKKFFFWKYFTATENFEYGIELCKIEIKNRFIDLIC